MLSDILVLHYIEILSENKRLQIYVCVLTIIDHRKLLPARLSMSFIVINDHNSITIIHGQALM